jgi:hypothetical protein
MVCAAVLVPGWSGLSTDSVGEGRHVQTRSVYRPVAHSPLVIDNERRSAMDPEIGVLRQLDHEWESIVVRHRGSRAIRKWGAGESALCGMRTLGEVIDRVNERGHPEESDAVLLILLRHAAADDLAARTVLQAMMPAVKRMTAKFSTCGAWSAEETAAVVVAAMWERIRCYPVDRRPRKASANLSLDTRQRVWRTGMKQVHGRVPRSNTLQNA